MTIPSAICTPNRRLDFLFLFDVLDGNPNGDPDAGNLPRVDPETMQGIVTDVCIKRKIRNYVDIVNQMEGRTDHDNGIFVRDSGVALNTKIKEAALSVGASADKKKTNLDSRAEMCRRYYDIRLFGGVLSVGEYNSGQVRGPMQITFSRSVDPIIPSDVTITRVAITKENENKETEMGRKALVPYGLYLGRGFFSPMLARDTGVTDQDMALFWQAMIGMFEQDRSASRGFMQMRRIVVFSHQGPLGNAPSGSLFGRLAIARAEGVEAARRYEDYIVTLGHGDLPEGVEVFDLI